MVSLCRLLPTVDGKAHLMAASLLQPHADATIAGHFTLFFFSHSYLLIFSSRLGEWGLVWPVDPTERLQAESHFYGGHPVLRRGDRFVITFWFINVYFFNTICHQPLASCHCPHSHPCTHKLQGNQWVITKLSVRRELCCNQSAAQWSFTPATALSFQHQIHSF